MRVRPEAAAWTGWIAGAAGTAAVLFGLFPVAEEARAGCQALTGVDIGAPGAPGSESCANGRGRRRSNR